MSFFTKNKISPHRLRQIAEILAKYGFEYIAERTNLKKKVPFQKNKSIEIVKIYNPYERARMVLEDLGPTFVKFGQILSTRPDLVGEKLSQELSKLQDAVRPFTYEEVEQEIKLELGKPINEIFRSFEHTPLASASVAQVHKAITKKGKQVVVKVQRPGIEPIIKQDLQIMHYLAALAQRHNPAWEHYRLPEIVEEFERSISKELNFELEGKNIMRFAEMYKDDKNIIIPEYIPKYSSKRILTMSFIDGVPLTSIIEGSAKKDCNKQLIAKIAAEAYFKQVLVNGFFHADLHPGNILILDENKIAFVDFGIVGWIEEDSINDLSKLFINLIDCDVKNIINQLSAMNLIDEEIDLENLKIDISDLMESYYGLDLKEIKLGETATQLMLLLTKYNIKIPKEYTMLSRSLLLVEGSATKLDPTFNAVEVFQPYARKLAAQKLNPLRLIDKMKTEILELEGLTRTIPRIVRNILSKIEGGKIKLEFEHKNLDIFAHELDHITNQIVLALVLAALIIGSSVAMLANSSLNLSWLPVLTVTLFMGSAILGFVLAIGSLKKLFK
ncbi:MAG: AarF/ABC1/UbiB kinase family protein [archaeon]|jgi:ubiquinone biosynthesis protein